MLRDQWKSRQVQEAFVWREKKKKKNSWTDMKTSNHEWTAIIWNVTLILRSLNCLPKPLKLFLAIDTWLSRHAY